MKSIRVASLVVCLIAGPVVSFGHEGQDHVGPHGGKLAVSGSHHFEVVFAKTGLKVYPLTADQKSLDASRLTGTATFYHPNAPEKPWFQMPLRPSAATLDLIVDLSTVPSTGAKVAIDVVGLADPAAPKATIMIPFALAALAPPLPPARLVYSIATRADDAAIAAQRVCKVSGKPLGSMGGPIKVSLGERSTFLCCMSCMKRLQANPEAYLPAAPSMKITADKATQADQSAVTAQKTCPVSHEDLTSMGGAIKVVRGSRSVFVCCPSCVKDIQTNPDKYLGATVSAGATKAR